MCKSFRTRISCTVRRPFEVGFLQGKKMKNLPITNPSLGTGLYSTARCQKRDTARSFPVGKGSSETMGMH